MSLTPKYLTQEQKNKLKKSATIASLSLSISLCLLKIFGALYTGSLAVLSSMIDSLTDIFASAITVIAVRYSSQPESYYFRYGYGKAEAISALIQSAFIAGSGIFIMYDGVNRIFYPRVITQTSIGILIMVIALISTLCLVYYQRYVTKLTASQAISADSAHYLVDILTNISIIFSLIIVKYFNINWFDSLTAIGISTYLLYNAYKIAAEAVNTLMDAELNNEIRQNIKDIVMECPFSKGIHDLRTHDLGGRYMFEFHLELDGELSLAAAHDMTELVEDNLLDAYPNAVIIIHQDPVGIKEERLDNKLKINNKKKSTKKYLGK